MARVLKVGVGAGGCGAEGSATTRQTTEYVAAVKGVQSQASRQRLLLEAKGQAARGCCGQGCAKPSIQREAVAGGKEASSARLLLEATEGLVLQRYLDTLPRKKILTLLDRAHTEVGQLCRVDEGHRRRIW